MATLSVGWSADKVIDEEVRVWGNICYSSPHCEQISGKKQLQWGEVYSS